mgnify:CR=1 FL=1
MGSHDDEWTGGEPPEGLADGAAADAERRGDLLVRAALDQQSGGRVTLGVGVSSLDYGGTRSFDAFDRFLKGRLSGAQFDIPQLKSHAASLRAALAIDPDYALAWANLAICLSRLRGLMSSSDGASFEAERAEATRRALALAPDLPLANVAEGWLQADRRNWLAAEEAFQHAMARGPRHDPADPGERNQEDEDEERASLGRRHVNGRRDRQPRRRWDRPQRHVQPCFRAALRPWCRVLRRHVALPPNHD